MCFTNFFTSRLPRTLAILVAISTGLISQVNAALVITEIMYHPKPLSDNDAEEAGEFLELFNSGENSLDLGGYQFDRGITFLFPENSTLPAGEYLILAKNPTRLEEATGLQRTLGPYEGTLSNSGETIQLIDPLQQTVVRFRYGTTGDWPAAPDGTGHSLVLADPNGNLSSGRNWTPSLQFGGTPGRNGFPVNNPSDLVRSLIRKGTTGRYFKGTKEPSNGTTRWTEPDFSTDTDWRLGRSGFGYSNNSNELVPVTTRLNDMRGNYLSVYVRLPFEVSPDEIKRLAQLQLTMHYDDSYVIYLNGTRIASAGVNGSPPAFDQISNAGDDYPPHSIDLTQRATLLVPGTNLLAIQGHNIGLNNSSDFVLAPELDLHLSAEPTPKELAREIQINELRTNHESESDFVEFYNPTDQSIDLSGMWLSDKSEELGRHQIPEGTTLGAMGFLVIELSDAATGFAISSLGDQLFLSTPDLDSVIAAYAFGAQPLNTSIGRFPDGGSNWYRSLEPSPGQSNNRHHPAPVMITEVMYNDPLTQRNEYIEIRNLDSTPIDVTQWRMQGVEFRFGDGLILNAGQSYIIADDSSAFQNRYSINSDQILGSYGGSLNNRGERLSILDQDDIVVDTVRYDDNFPWPITPDGLGASLERTCFDAEPDTASAWSASPLNRPSPGAQNNVERCDPPGSSSVHISEIMYHPATETDDDRLGEYIELTNTATTSVDLSGWVVAGDVFYVIADSTVVDPGATIVIAWNPVALVAKHQLSSNQVIGPYFGSLPNGRGEILLVRNDGRLADRVGYQDDFPWPSLADGGENGADRSLSRLCSSLSGDLPENWHTNNPPSPGEATGSPADCAPPTQVIRIGTEPQQVTPTTEPVLQAEFSGSTPTTVTAEYWIDDPEASDEPTDSVSLNDQGTRGDLSAGDGVWSATLPALPANSIVRYRIRYSNGNQSETSPASNRDSFAWHAYFVDPMTDSNLPNNYHLFISSENWRTLHQATEPGRVTRGRANPRWNDEVPAVFVAEGVVHDVNVRHQGSRWNRKNGSTINFPCPSHRSGSAQVRSWRIDFPSHRNHDGMDVILLQKQSGWPQHISFKMFELAGVPAPRTSWANLRINGCNYNNDAFQIERPGRDLVARWFIEPGDLFKSQGFTGNEGPWSWGDARLIRGSRNGSTEQQRYEHTYNRKTHRWKNNPFDGAEDFPEPMIEALHRARQQGPAALRQWLGEHFDVDRTLRYICTINYVGTFDDMFQNHYLYRRADNGKWCMFPWDMDNTLGGSFGKQNANPFRGVNEARHGNVGNRSGWWNRIKDSFFIAYEAEFLSMFHRLNNTVHSPDQMRPFIEEGAALSGRGTSSVNSLMSHMNGRHRYLNNFISPLLSTPTLTIAHTARGARLEWPVHRSDVRLEQADDPEGPWIPFTGGNDGNLELGSETALRFFRLAPNR